jgi:hypothetical protein
MLLDFVVPAARIAAHRLFTIASDLLILAPILRSQLTSVLR